MEDFLNQRIERFQQVLQSHDLEGFLVENPSDIKYLTHLDVSAGKLLIDKEKAQLILDNRYFDFAKKNSPLKILKKLDVNALNCVGFDSEDLSFHRISELRREFTKTNWIPCNNLLKIVRSVKDAYEIQCLRESRTLLERALEKLMTFLKVGVREKELATRFKMICLELGADGIAFESIVAFGENSAYPHYHPSDRKLSPEDSVLIDIGLIWKGYHSDITRSFPMGCKNSEYHKIHAFVKEALSKAQEFALPGKDFKDVDALVRKHFEDKGFGKHFLHRIGHGVGLEIHEFPSARGSILKENMVLTLEPGIYVEGLGGVRLEEMFLITPFGAKPLVENFSMR